jgi:hypothetical protein
LIIIFLINNGSPKQKIAIGRIELMRKFSFIEADSRFSRVVLQAFHQLMINGKKVSIAIDAGPKKQFAARNGSMVKGRKKREHKPKQNKRAGQAH